MKIAIVLLEDAKQIMLTPENDFEKEALKSIAPEDEIIAKSKWGTFMDEEKTYGYNIMKCRGDYYRAYSSNDSLMLIVSKKKKEQK